MLSREESEEKIHFSMLKREKSNPKSPISVLQREISDWILPFVVLQKGICNLISLVGELLKLICVPISLVGGLQKEICALIFLVVELQKEICNLISPFGGLQWRDFCQLLREKCQFQIPYSAVRRDELPAQGRTYIILRKRANGGLCQNFITLQKAGFGDSSRSKRRG
jgi:hypothetical protein